MKRLDDIAELLKDQPGKPPVEKWHPPLSGEIDIIIQSDGRWFHEGGEIKRHPLVKLFASILRREQDGEYYLVTPVEKWRIQVEEFPLQIIDSEVAPDRIAFMTNVDEWLLLGADHPLAVSTDPATGEPIPRVAVDRGLEAKLNRSVFYRLVEQATEENGELWLSSNGQRFSLGVTE